MQSADLDNIFSLLKSTFSSSKIQKCPAPLECPWGDRGPQVKTVQQSNQTEGECTVTLLYPHSPHSWVTVYHCTCCNRLTEGKRHWRTWVDCHWKFHIHLIGHFTRVEILKIIKHLRDVPNLLWHTELGQHLTKIGYKELRDPCSGSVLYTSHLWYLWRWN